MHTNHLNVRRRRAPEKDNASSRLAFKYFRLKRHFTIRMLDLVLLSNVCVLGVLLAWIGGAA